MEDTEKTREQLLEELADLRRSIAEMQDQRNQQGSGNSEQVNEGMYAALCKNSLVPILLTVPDGLILDANEAACRMFGRTKEELCRLGRDAVVDVADSRLAIALEERRKNGSWRGELKLKRSDGTVFPAEAASKIFYDFNGTQKTCLVIRDITERKVVEAALRNSEIRYRTLFENMGNAVAVYGAERDGEDFVILDFNKAASTIEQVASNEVIGRSVLEVFPGVRQFGLFDVFQRVWRTGNAEHYPVALYKDERISGWRDNFVYRLPSGEVVAVYSDETERKKAESALRESESRFQAFMENAPMVAFTKDDQGRFVYCNKKWLSMRNLIDKDWQGKTAEQIFPPDLAATFTETDDIALTQNRLFEYVVPAPNSDGSLSHWWTFKFPFRAAEGRLYLGGAAIDISLQIRALEELKESDEKLRRRTEELKTVLDAQPAFVLFAHDTECRVITGNQTANEVFGVPADTNVSRTAEEKPQGVPIKRLKNDGTEYRPDELPLQRAAATGKPVFDEEIEYRFPDGRQMFIRGNAVPLFDARGGIRGGVAAFLDITKLKQVERERESLRSQLFQLQKMEAIGTLAAGIAHDFNNMLQVILGYSDLLLLGKRPGEPGYEELQKIIKTSLDARDLVQKIRLVSRRADIQPVPRDLNQDVEQAAQLLQRTLPRTVNLSTHLTRNLALVKAEPALMKQMVMNLGINAGEAMPEGGTLTIKTENKALEADFCRMHPGLEPGLHVLLTVSDTGKGIPPEALDKLFDPFYSTKERDYHKGTGLGLPVVRGIVEMHKGFIDVESELGRGTSVRIYLPVMEVIEAPKKEEEIEQPLGGTETILLVEDEELVRNLGVYALEQFGYKVLAAVGGQEALEIYEREKENISLVILDIIMPRMDGKQCFKELLRINPDIKVLISSGIIQRELIQEVVNLGAKGLLVKPFNVMDLLRKVREVIDSD